MAKIFIDGTQYDVEDNANLLEACLALGLDLPYFCWHPSLGSVGSCRQCAVRVYADDNDSRGRIVMGCMTPVSHGMRLSIEEPDVKRFRDRSIEVTMANHPHDCPVCEEGGECHLQDMTIMSEHTTRRHRGKKKTYENQYLGPCISHEMNRCITCYRCVRFYNDYAGGEDLAALSSRENVYFGRHEEGCLENVFSGNLVEVCPTGVFTDKTLSRSYNRKWDLQTAPSICGGCGVGCNIAPGERQGKIKRIINRYNDAVNGYFICDRGRFGYDHINDRERISKCVRRINVASDYPGGDAENEILSRKVLNESDTMIYHSAIAYICDMIKENGTENIIGIGSERASVEENFLLKELVGDNNFCSGVSGVRSQILEEVLRIYQSPEVSIPSLKDIESCDAILILGEDILSVAPRMALSIRQATRNKSFQLAEDAGIPLWQDAAVRNLAQDNRSPLIIASVGETGLHDVASECFYYSPDDLAFLGFAVAELILGEHATSNDIPLHLLDAAKTIADLLTSASNPLIIGGASLNSLSLVKASAHIAFSLSRFRQADKENSKAHHSPPALANLCFAMPESNSLGLTLLCDKETLDLDLLFKREFDSPPTVIVLQNDLYRHNCASVVDKFLDRCKLCVIDQIHSRTTEKADILIPATDYVESEGTLVNYEGRAQRYFKVFSSANPCLKDNWKTFVNIARAIINSIYVENGSKKVCADRVVDLASLQSFDDVIALLKEHADIFQRWSEIAPDAKFRVAGQKIPRQPHRYSGRTSMRADIKVSELKQPVDHDSALGFTMEGVPIDQPSSLNAHVWSPGWNSNEAIHKFQDEIGGSLKGKEQQVCLFDEKRMAFSYKKSELTVLGADTQNEFVAVSQARFFDGNELAYQSLALAQRAAPRTLILNRTTASRAGLTESGVAKISVEDCSLSLSVSINQNTPDGIILIPDDVHSRIELPISTLPKRVVIESLDTSLTQ